MMPVERYLEIPRDYGQYLGGLRWSSSGEAVEHIADDPAVGLTFAMSAEIALFLEGLAGDGFILHFAHVLHVLHLLGYGQTGDQERTLEFEPVEEFGWFAYLFDRMKRPLRNAGALSAALCRDVPHVPDPPRLDDLILHLKQRPPTRSGRYAAPPSEPALAPQLFRDRVRQSLQKLTPNDVRHWLRHGRGPASNTGDAIARALPLSLTTAELLTRLESRPRLQGASALVAKLSGALALPPRRLTQAELPVGGYSDVATRGLPEQILPAQLALDPDEFLRRFAARELLYYEREEPRAPTARELILLVDQGVRTWGDVRIILAAATLALARQGDRRGLTVRLATTRHGGALVDLPGAGLDAVGALLDASDLSAHPAAALTRVLGGSGPDLGATPRDVVLLTHPRSLAEPAVMAAAREPGEGNRLFAVTVEANGDVSLAELRQGAPVTLAHCHVGLADRTAQAQTQPQAPAGAMVSGLWQGDVESVGYPFRLGPTFPINDRLFDFDLAGDWLLLADRIGLLRAWRTDESTMEMLPRAMIAGKVLADVDAVVGVAGGFVVAGKADDQTVVAHYDFSQRTCTVHPLRRGVMDRLWLWYAPEHHCVVGFESTRPNIAIDLDAPPGSTTPRSTRAHTQCEAIFPGVQIVEVEPPQKPNVRPGRLVCLHESKGFLTLRDESGVSQLSVPMAEGRRRFLGARLLAAHWRGNNLGLLVARDDDRRQLVILGLTGGEPIVHHEFTLLRDVADFAFSRDGRQVAFRTGGRWMAVRRVANPTLPTLTVVRAQVHDRLTVELGATFLAVQAARHAHLIRWDRGPLELHRSTSSLKDAIARHYAHDRDRISTPLSKNEGWGKDVGLRFYAGAWNSQSELHVLVDRLGQIVIQKGMRVVVMFHVFRDQVSAWTPEGARLGPAAITGGPPTLNAAAQIAEALRAASRHGQNPGD